QVGTATLLSASASSVPEGQPVAFTATVSSDQGPPDGGQVDFRDGQVDLGTANVDTANGVATLSPPVVLSAGEHHVTAVYSGDATLQPTLPVGMHHVTAVYSGYSGDTDFAGSFSSAVAVMVNPSGPAATTTFLTASATNVNPGDPVTFTATAMSESAPPRPAD